MPTQVQPVAGRWYYDAAGGRRLQVTRIDENDEFIEARFEDGSIERYQRSAWQALPLQPQGEDDSSGYLSNEAYRRATGWAEKSPDDFPDG